MVNILDTKQKCVLCTSKKSKSWWTKAPPPSRLGNPSNCPVYHVNYKSKTVELNSSSDQMSAPV